MSAPSGMTAYDEARLIAAVDLLRRTGTSEFQLRYSDDEKPVVWMAVAGWKRGGQVVHEAAAAIDPLRAALRLCEQAVDGAQCTHCRRPAGLEPDSLDTMPMDKAICWYQYDPELKTFRRGCA